MFATQQHLEALDAGRKRFRDNEELAVGTAGFGEHRHKRFQSSLPLRNSNRTPQQYLSHTIMPLNASPAVAGPRHTIDTWTPSTINNYACDADADMNLMDTVQSTLSDHNGSATVSGAQHIRSTGRTPTPIQPSFAAQIRGPNAAWAPPPAATVPNGIVNLGHHVTGFCQDKCMPRAMSGSHVECHMLQNNRRLPSPISEFGNSTTNSQTCTSSDMAMDHDKCLDAQAHSAAHCLCSASYQPSTHAMEHPNAMIDVETRSNSNLTQSSESDADPLSPSPGRKGHQRSKHTVNSWTWQPGMKKSFSIGYRSDCEKCQLKVPGHFNHIVIS
ncbi:hypothetical protein E4U42_002769 [Claviceps africana]|uniref:Uncharacterized protein n=1 Tax=Claviceps africana TaxID=83212 RepID=A0A8K0J7V1_9HYPO|nr:hypothetical protein E4U42_002769 [Claviceps africana]